MVKGTNTQYDLDGIFGIVLAGGKSSRMGSDKAQLAFKGGTLLEYQIKKLVSILGSGNVVVSGHYPSFRHITDQEPELGPLGGISSVVRGMAQAEYFLFLPVDMPNIKEKTLFLLIQAAKNDFTNNCWVFRHYQMPLLLKNNKALESVLTKLTSQPRTFRSVRSLCEYIQCQAVDTQEALNTEFFNANTIREWKEVANEHTR